MNFKIILLLFHSFLVLNHNLCRQIILFHSGKKIVSVCPISQQTCKPLSVVIMILHHPLPFWKKGDCTYHFGFIWVHCDFCRLLSNEREKWVKESSDHIDHYRNKKAKSIPFIISIFHPVYSKFVRESTWILFKRTINQCSIYIIKCERRIMWKISIYTWSYDPFKCSCNVVSLKSEVSCFATRN